MSVAAVNERLAALTAAGTSIWLDQMSRGMIESGELARMVDEDSLRGVTSNPAIFEKSILGTADYDEGLAEAAREGLSAREVYRRLAIADVQAAADVLRPVYEASGGMDGYVSLEVAPRLAHDTEGTLEQARMYWGLVSRPNLMVKIPATEEGIPAIETALYEGMNVNITLLFSVDWYRRVMEAFISAMERRLAEEKTLGVHSVASFFVSRVDSEVDRRLEALGRSDLEGRAAVANARAAYRAFKEVFHGGRFSQLREMGCPAQRPLWASTGVKNPRYPETKYVDELVGTECVNTMPLATLLAAADRADASEARIERDPQPDLDALREAGIDLDDVTDGLLRDGIEIFQAAMKKLLDGIEKRREIIVTARPATIDADLPSALEGPVRDRLQLAQDQDVARRIWQRDPTVWAPEGTPELVDRLGWLTIADRIHEEAGPLLDFVKEVQGAGFTDALLLGMGGSSLAPEVFRRSYAEAGGLTLHVLDTTEPVTINAFAEKLDPATTLVIVSTKSGGTIETLSLFKHFWAWSGETGERFVAVTDPGSGLEKLAAEHGFRKTFLNDPEIGGRYSALSYFGLVPAALAGIDVEGHLHGSEVAEVNCQDWHGPEHNSGLWLGGTLGELALQGRDKVSFLVDAPLQAFGLWAEQLVAESTGKQGKGTLPIADEPMSHYLASYGEDRVFVHLANADAPDETHDTFIAAVAAEGHPTITLRAHGPGDLGRVFFFSEFATAVAGWALQINPFDQPNVQEAKDNTARALKDGVDADDGDIGDLLDGLAAPGYVAIMGYLPYDEAVDAAILHLRSALLEHFGVATTFGYGPRFLHSTGQYHKGGPPQGRFLQLTHDGDADAEIPGEAFSFRRLITAQADGDLATLRAHGRPAVRVKLSAGDLAGGIDALAERVRAG
jgi:transaldolase/glucose-6-phosphate isomerase